MTQNLRRSAAADTAIDKMPSPAVAAPEVESDAPPTAHATRNVADHPHAYVIAADEAEGGAPPAKATRRPYLTPMARLVAILPMLAVLLILMMAFVHHYLANWPPAHGSATPAPISTSMAFDAARRLPPAPVKDLWDFLDEER